uniref:hypothetical protein n=1 Tax=Psychrobacter sp. TaxID=56811 RepID=UPI001597C17C|nr:hypothetical protein [Psychrobacter sp.]QJS05489.1 hypothetical protein [Psychrobacter sp.]
MNQKQYIRLSIVLAVPALVISFWLAQQDFVFNRGQLVQCSIIKGYCYNEKMSLDDLDEIGNNNNLLTYSLNSPERLFVIYDLDLPMRFYFQSNDNGRELDITNLMNERLLAENSCSISIGNHINCEQDVFSFASSHGRLEFINPEDDATFINRINEGKSYFKDDSLIRIAISFGLFLSIAAVYLVFSWLVHFIIYGARIGKPKKRPYQ